MGPPSFWDKVRETENRVSIEIRDQGYVDKVEIIRQNESWFGNRRTIPGDYTYLNQGAVASLPPPQLKDVAGIGALWEELSRELVLIAKDHPASCAWCIFLCLYFLSSQSCIIDKYQKKPLSELAARMGPKFAAIGLQLSYYDLSDNYYHTTGMKAGIRHFYVVGLMLEKTGREQYALASMGVASPALGIPENAVALQMVRAVPIKEDLY
ncbi:hypothetical protein B484DRAFT_440541 [Ochromonadaceae sp. CCMP2298]|nr:hypothetical protein B484DRAFT_440541 [Ochromonadaceae sp. CCMP2298]